jgi:acetylornithine deacetylase/succinyl-diaminopimelate desuccinylase-like protein
MRLVPNQNPDKIYQSFKKYVKSLTPKNVEIRIINHSNALPYKAPTASPIFGIAKKALKTAFHKEALFTGVGGSIGFVPIMAKALGVPCLMIGFGLPDDGAHAPNEHFHLDNYLNGIKAMMGFYKTLGSL